MRKLIKLVTYPFYLFLAQFYPVLYAKVKGVNIEGSVKIYGSSYKMFGSEPYLITLGDNVYISVDASFVTHDGSVLPFRKIHPTLEVASPISVGDNVFIGTRALILPGVNIGNNVVIGANSVVTKNVPDNSVYAGCPAKYIMSSDEYLTKALEKSLGFGHLKGIEKVKEYKRYFCDWSY